MSLIKKNRDSKGTSPDVAMLLRLWCEKRESNPHTVTALDPKSSVSASSTILACMVSHGGFEPPTP